MNRRSRGFLIDVLRQCDYILLGLCLVCSAFGLVMIASATRYMSSMRYVAVQAAATALGVILYILMSSVDLPEMTKKGWKWILLANFVLILLLRTPFGAADDTGNRAWLKFPFLPVMVQPAELVKIGYILLLAKQLDWLKKEKNDLKSIKSMAFLGGHFLILFGLYYVISSDMGSDLVLLFIFMCMCFVGGVALRWFVLGLGGGGIAFYLLWQEDLIPEYMKKRFIVLFDHSYDTLDTGRHPDPERLFRQFAGTAHRLYLRRHRRGAGDAGVSVGAGAAVRRHHPVHLRGGESGHADGDAGVRGGGVHAAVPDDRQRGYVPVCHAGHRLDAALFLLRRLVGGGAVCGGGAGVQRAQPLTAGVAAVVFENRITPPLGFFARRRCFFPYARL